MTTPDHEVLQGRVATILDIVAAGVRVFLMETLGESSEPLGHDPQPLLQHLERQWDVVARGWFDPQWRTVRGHVGELRDVRVRWAHVQDHPKGPFTAEDVGRATDTAGRLLAALSEAAFRERPDGPVRRQLSADATRAILAQVQQLEKLPSLSSERSQLDKARQQAEAVMDVATATAAAKLAQAEGRLLDALANAERAVSLSGRGVYSLNLLAGVQRRLRWLNEAEGIARESVERGGILGNMAGHAVLAAVLCDRGSSQDLEEAIAVCDQALGAAPDNIFVRNVRSRARFLRGHQRQEPDDPSSPVQMEADDDDDVPF